MKLNLHFRLDAASDDWARRSNAAVRAVTPSQIDFSETGRMTPHVTMAMGFLAEGASLQAVQSDLEAFMVGLTETDRRIDCAVTDVHLDVTQGRYILLDLAPAAAFLDLRRAVRALLLREHLVVGGSYADTPHVTLAYVENDAEGARAAALASPPPARMVLSGLALGQVGSRGAVISTLASWPADTETAARG